MFSKMTSVKRFFQDDSGEAAVGNVLVVAVGAIVLLAVLAMWNTKVSPGVQQLIGDVLKTKGS
jgi:Flp pilus assembly pilin Flp